MRKAELYPYITGMETGSEQLSNFPIITELGGDGVRTQTHLSCSKAGGLSHSGRCPVPSKLPGIQQRHHQWTFLFSARGILEQFSIAYPLFFGMNLRDLTFYRASQVIFMPNSAWRIPASILISSDSLLPFILPNVSWISFLNHKSDCVILQIKKLDGLFPTACRRESKYSLALNQTSFILDYSQF